MENVNVITTSLRSSEAREFRGNETAVKAVEKACSAAFKKSPEKITSEFSTTAEGFKVSGMLNSNDRSFTVTEIQKASAAKAPAPAEKEKSTGSKATKKGKK